MKKIFCTLAVFLICVLLLAGGGSLALTLYYQGKFPVNTWINGIYCTGKTVEQVNEELVSLQPASTVCIVDAGRTEWKIDMGEADIRPDYTEALSSYREQNGMFSWWKYLWEPLAEELAVTEYVMDGEKLRAAFDALPFVEQERSRPEGVYVYYREERYGLQDGNAQRLNFGKAYAYLKDCLSGGVARMDLAEAGCYENLPDTAEDMKQRELWKKMGEFADRAAGLTYDMGAELIPFTSDLVFRFLEKAPEDGIPLLDESGKLMISETAVREWVEELASAYDTCDTERKFTSTRGDVVSVKYVTYGTKLDVEAEAAYLLDILQADSVEEQVHIPAYLQQGYVRGLDDIGGTYIEIDMTEQKMYYYVESELVLETDVVTGNTGRRMGTPEGIHFVYSKQEDRILSGPGYASFVKYWMPVKGNIGIHDASWRTSFGGTIYQANGSHGCINTPADAMAQLYEMADVGTPVIMFY